jgi:Rho-binding antiterminator
MTRCTVSCELHDYLEIACLYAYQVRLILKDHQIIEGKAIDTMTTAEKREYLLIDNGKKQPIELMQIKKMQVLTANAQFSEVVF